jgi:hypothetical protein
VALLLRRPRASAQASRQHGCGRIGVYASRRHPDLDGGEVSDDADDLDAEHVAGDQADDAIGRGCGGKRWGRRILGLR